MRRAKQATGRGRWLRWLGGLGFLPLLLLASQLRCADVDMDWQRDDNTDMPGGPGDGGPGDGFEDPNRCFTGTATSELQLLNHCTEAEHVDRAHNIPTTTWDGKLPLP